VAKEKDYIFNAGSELLLERLSQAATQVGDALDASLEELAQKVRSQFTFTLHLER
jgi:hypothetical protein